MVSTKKFSEFNDGGVLVEGETTVGLKGTTNSKFATPPQFLPAGPTIDRPSPATNGMIRYNTELNLYEYYNGTDWVQFEDSGDVANILARLAAHTPGNGASMIGLLNQAGVANKTVQDMADATFIVQSNNGSLANAQYLDTLPTGFLISQSGLGIVESRQFQDSLNQIEWTNASGTGNPVAHLSATLQLPGTLQLGGAMDAANFAITNVPTPVNGGDAVNKAYADSLITGLTFIDPVLVCDTANFDATYDNGVAGVGATLTANVNGAANVDGVALTIGDRVLFPLQTNQVHNGIYEVTQVGDGSNPAIYTRTTDYDTPAEIVPGDIVVVQDGTVNGGTLWIQTAVITTIGTDPIQFSELSLGGNFVTLNTTQTITGQKTMTALIATLVGDLNTNGNALVSGAGQNISITPGAGGEIQLTSATLQNNLDGDMNRGVNFADPINPQDVATKGYVDTTAGGIPTGFVSFFAGTSAPAGWAVANGAAISRTTFAALFAAIGTTWGVGDGSTTFNLPDLRGRAPVGSGGTSDATLGNAVGSVGGTRTVSLTAAQNGPHTHTYTRPQTVTANLAPGGVTTRPNPVQTLNTGSSGSGAPHNNIQPSAVLLPCIKL
jgi:microcystin-dependent protein